MRRTWALLGAVTLAVFALEAFAVPQPMTREEVAELSQTGLGFSYWWGHGRWRTDNTSFGACSNGTHSGSYGADCSGYVAKVWQLPSPITVDVDGHPYDTCAFNCGQTYWTRKSMGALQRGDAAVARGDGTCPCNGTGHMVVYDQPSEDGRHWVWEAKGCAYGILHDLKSFASTYRAIQRNGLSPAPTTVPVDPTPEELAWSTAQWGEASATSDVDGDGKADLCARASAGWRCYLSTGSSFLSPFSTGQLQSAAGWDAVEYSSTLRMADLDGDGKADVCARGPTGILCMLSTGTGFGAPWDGPPLSDAAGWKAAPQYQTLRMADINGDGKADLCARATDGMHCWLSTGAGFGLELLGPLLGDASGWSAVDRYSTLRMGDIDADGRADLCARASDGIHCWLSTGTGFGQEVLGPALSDASGWNQPQHYLTLRMADVNGDGKADLCGRGALGWSCWLSEGTRFGPAYASGAMSDAAGWDAPSSYSTLRMGDVNGDGKADVCARGAIGAYCWLWTPNGHTQRLTGPAWSNSLGWNDPANYRTFRLADIDGDGRADLCGRGDTGVACHRSTGSGFGPALTGPPMSDTGGWGTVQFYGTVRLATAPPGPSTPVCQPQTEVCDSVDNDCDGFIDEGCVFDAPDAGEEEVLLDAGSGDVGELEEPADAGPSDAGQPPDAGAPGPAEDAGVQTPSPAEETVPDAGPPEPQLEEEAPAPEGCGCGAPSAGVPGMLLALLLGGAARRRRR